jgi:uncharacterized damage-inducible protein DinB
MMLEHLRQMTRYNRWVDRRLYAACEGPSVGASHGSRAAFFRSTHGTLNHCLVAGRLGVAHRGQVHDQLSRGEMAPARLDLINHIRESTDH